MKKIPLFKTYISMRSVWNVCALLLKSNFGAYVGEGPQVKAFEQEFGKMFSFEHVASVNSGSSALDLAYELAEIREGDEVIISAITHPASGLPGVHRKAKIIFADVEDDLNLSVEDVRRKITPHTKAIVFVHFGGNNRGLRELLELVREKNIILIEDAAQAVGSEFWGKSDFTCVSLQAIKTLTSGDGGFIICKDKAMHEKAKRLRWFGYDRDRKQKEGDTDITEPGFKYHMSDITAAIGRGNLRALPKLLAHRRALAAEYAKYGINAHIWLATTLSDNRDRLMEYLKESGIHTGIYHYRNDKYTIFGGKQSLPHLDIIENKYLMLPLHHGMTVSDVGRLAAYLKTFDHEISKS